MGSLGANLAILIWTHKSQPYCLGQSIFSTSMVAKNHTSTTHHNTQKQQSTTIWHEPGDVSTMASFTACGRPPSILAQQASLPYRGWHWECLVWFFLSYLGGCLDHLKVMRDGGSLPLMPPFHWTTQQPTNQPKDDICCERVYCGGHKTSVECVGGKPFNSLRQWQSEHWKKQKQNYVQMTNDSDQL